MESVVQKWGNSNALRIPKKLLDSLSIKTNDVVELIQTDNSIIIKKPNAHLTIKERYERFYGKPISQIKPSISKEIDWGEIKGDELW